MFLLQGTFQPPSTKLSSSSLARESLPNVEALRETLPSWHRPRLLSQIHSLTHLASSQGLLGLLKQPDRLALSLCYLGHGRHL